MKRKLRSASTSGSSKKNFNVPLSIVTFFLGVIATFAITQVFAQTNDSNQIFACVNNTNGNVRIVSAHDNCKTAEKSIKWSVQGPQGIPGSSSSSSLPFFCTDCVLTPFAERFAGKDYSYANIRKSDFDNSNLTGVIFKGGNMDQTFFKNANLTGADLSSLKYAPAAGGTRVLMNNANLTNANLSNNTYQSSDFTNANIQNTNFSNAVFKSTKLNGAQNASTANFTGATWQNTTCPDGTNSDTNGSTCEGHF